MQKSASTLNITGQRLPTESLEFIPDPVKSSNAEYIANDCESGFCFVPLALENNVLFFFHWAVLLLCKHMKYASVMDSDFKFSETSFCFGIT